MITIAEARKIAEDSAEQKIRCFCQSKNQPVLQKEFLESEYAWLFFRNPEIKIPEKNLLSCDWSYAISKRGAFREFYNLSDKNEMKKEFDKLSEHFKENGI